MPTNYPGNPAALESPSALPGSQDIPTVVLPIDGENANVASIEQAFKVLADFTANTIRPRSNVGDGSPIIQYRNAVLQSRFGIDHLGFPAGRIQRWQEDWGDVLLTQRDTPGTAPWAGRWLYSLIGADALASISTQTEDTGELASWSRFLDLETTTVNTSCASVETLPFTKTVNGVSIAYQTEVLAGGDLVGPLTSEVSFGICDQTQQGVGGAFSARGFGFMCRPGDANWQAWAHNFGGAFFLSDTGHAGPGDTLYRARFRCEYYSAAAADDGVEKVLFYVDGALVAAPAVSLGGRPMRAFFRNLRQATGVAPFDIEFGVTDLAANLWAGDVFL